MAPIRAISASWLALNDTQGLKDAPGHAGVAVSVKKCGNCELVFADPQPIPDRFEAHYGAPEDYWTAEQIEDEPNDFAQGGDRDCKASAGL